MSNKKRLGFLENVLTSAAIATTAMTNSLPPAVANPPPGRGNAGAAVTNATGQPLIAKPSALSPQGWDKYAYPELPAWGRDPKTEPVIDVGNGHKLHAQEFGNPNGEPLIMLHGGPGGGTIPKYLRWIDPKRYRIIAYDQRGCGLSTPTTHTNFDAAMKDNNTAALVEDINAVREHFNIKGKMHLAGGSWGTTLALAYAVKYPENVKSLTLRGVFLGTERGVKYLYQGNAATYNEADKPLADNSKPEEVRTFIDHFNRQNFKPEGSYRAYMGDGSLPGQIPAKYHPSHSHMIEAYARAWDQFVRLIPKSERGNMVVAYMNRLEAKPDPALADTGKYDAASNSIDPKYQLRLALASSMWEGTVSFFSHAAEANGKIDLNKFVEPDFAVDLARMELRYSHNGFYLTDDGSPARSGSNYLIDGLPRIAKHNIPIFMVHGANDQVCPVRDALLLKEKYEDALRKAGHSHPAQVVLDSRPENGHAGAERANTLAAINAINHLPVMSRAEKMGEPRAPKDHVVGEPSDRRR